MYEKAAHFDAEFPWQLPNVSVFRTEEGRTIGAHSMGIIEALESVYQANALVREILGPVER